MRYENALQRLHTQPAKDGRMVRKDYLILLALVVVYAIVAYVNLGTTEVPSTQFDMSEQGQVIHIKFEEAASIKTVKYYAGLGEGTFSLNYSLDGTDFSCVKLTEARKERQELKEDSIRHMPRDMYQWNFVDVDFEAQYVDLKIEKTGMKLNELAFCDEEGIPVKIAAVWTGEMEPVAEDEDLGGFTDETGEEEPVNTTEPEGENGGLTAEETEDDALLAEDLAGVDMDDVEVTDASEEDFIYEEMENGYPENDPEVLFDEQGMVRIHTTYLTDMYFDEVYHARTALEHIEYIYPYEITHPPLGKIIIGIGIRIFGMNPFGWRFMGTLFGVLLIPLLYIFAKRLFRNTLFAFIASFLFTFDFMHYTQTRIATIDSYSVFFIILMYYFMYLYVQTNFNRDGLAKTLLPLGLCGITFGLGAATKWLCIYAGLGLAGIFFFMLYRRVMEYKACMRVLSGELVLAEGHGYDMELIEKTARTFRRNLTLTLAFCVLVFIIIPVIIYVLSYIPYLLVKDRTFTWKDIWENQKYMLNYHGNLKTDKPHPFESSWYKWPLDLRPVFFFQGEHMPIEYLRETVAGYEPVRYISNISTMGNPAVWWGGFAAVIFILVNSLRRKRPVYTALETGEAVMRRERGIRGNVFGKGMVFVAVAALSEYLPWTLISRETFIYHYFATVPFLILLLTYVLRYFYERFRHGKLYVYGFLVLVFVLFVAFFPILSGIIIPKVYADSIRWLPTWPFY